EEWIRFTGKPFVFAFWAVRQAALEGELEDLARIFQRSRDHGLEPCNVAAIAETWSQKIGMARMDIVEYLTANIHYHLDAACLEGLELFYRHARECGIIPRIPDLRFSVKPAFI